MLQLIAKITYMITLLVELLISLRFILKFVNANPQNPFSKWVFENSQPIIDPFKGLVQETYELWGFNIEIISLVVIICLMLISYILSQMIKTFSI
jgi:uncharacterized protein YggT (Ycf19 family)